MLVVGQEPDKVWDTNLKNLADAVRGPACAFALEEALALARRCAAPIQSTSGTPWVLELATAMTRGSGPGLLARDSRRPVMLRDRSRILLRQVRFSSVPSVRGAVATTTASTRESGHCLRSARRRKRPDRGSRMNSRWTLGHAARRPA
jgi:hypothetical protein